MQSTFFCLGKFLKWLADDQSSSIPKGSIYYIKHTYIHSFSMEVNWREFWHQMEVPTMVIFVDTAFLLCGAELEVNVSIILARPKQITFFFLLKVSLIDNWLSQSFADIQWSSLPFQKWKDDINNSFEKIGCQSTKLSAKKYNFSFLSWQINVKNKK